MHVLVVLPRVSIRTGQYMCFAVLTRTTLQGKFFVDAQEELEKRVLCERPSGLMNLEREFIMARVPNGDFLKVLNTIGSSFNDSGSCLLPTFIDSRPETVASALSKSFFVSLWNTDNQHLFLNGAENKGTTHSIAVTDFKEPIKQIWLQCDSLWLWYH